MAWADKWRGSLCAWRVLLNQVVIVEQQADSEAWTRALRSALLVVVAFSEEFVCHAHTRLQCEFILDERAHSAPTPPRPSACIPVGSQPRRAERERADALEAAAWRLHVTGCVARADRTEPKGLTFAPIVVGRPGGYNPAKSVGWPGRMVAHKVVLDLTHSDFQAAPLST